MTEPAPPTRLEDIPPEIIAVVAAALIHIPASLLALGRSTVAFRAFLLVGAEASGLWETAARRQLGPAAPDLARRASLPGTVGGLDIYRRALRLRDEVATGFEVVRGSVVAHAAGMAVVACPCLDSLINYGMGAQGAVRRAAGPMFETAARALRVPLEPLSATLVAGGALAPAVAMVVTTPPEEMQELLWHEAYGNAAVATALSKRLHANLFAAVRGAGHASIAMPTLATGGQGLDPACVCNGLAMALADDARAHPGEPLLLRVACFERAHLAHAHAAKARVLECLFDVSA